MPYRNETFANGEIYHVFARRPDGLPMFQDDRDHLRFLMTCFLVNREPPRLQYRLAEYNNAAIKSILNGKGYFTFSPRVRDVPLVRILTFCLMDTHFHFLFEQLQDGGIQEFMHRIGTAYAMYANKKYERRGPFFEHTFGCVHVQNNHHLRYLFGYIHLNPLDATGIPWRKVSLTAPWSSVEQVLQSHLWSGFQFYTQRQRFRALLDPGIFSKLFPTRESVTRHLSGWSGERFLYLKPNRYDF